ncbi:MAG: magnesium transporter CorA family protein [bacterium]
MHSGFELRDGRVVESASPDAPITVYIAPDEAERRLLIDTWKVDEHTLASALDPDEPARLEFEPEHFALIYKRPRNYSGRDSTMFKVSSSGVFLFKDRLFIVLPEDIHIFEGKQFNRVNSLREVLLKLIFRSIFHFLEHLKIINQISVELEQKINTAMENRYLINLFGLEKSLVYYVNSINSNGMLIARLKLSTAKLGLAAEEIELLDDIEIENTQCYKQAEIYSNILASLMDARASIVSNNLNVLVKTLNLITIGIMVPTLVVSIFSMNVRLPISDVAGSSFWIVVAMAAFSVGAFLYLWWRKRW